MSESNANVRPRATYLKQRTTQSRQIPNDSEPAVALELKLQTSKTRYWLCTEGLAQPQPGMPKSWVLDYITPEHLSGDGNWSREDAEAYGPQSTPWLQGNDYLQMLTDEYERLKQQHEKEANWTLAQQMEITQDEMRQVIQQMEAIVQQTQKV